MVKNISGRHVKHRGAEGTALVVARGAEGGVRALLPPPPLALPAALRATARLLQFNIYPETNFVLRTKGTAGEKTCSNTCLD
ncbi:unnamed protein product [Pieris macdunnoughi]|uniref:Uncharacterized protein n=1 Tax=Pieris macdunnoughi TaxID=345717 RepID=A0A821XA32_9NEOP|nr:unnamed protein product [Pieris macdunnoughi]